MAENVNAESVLGWVAEASDGPTISVLAAGDLCPIHRVAEPLAAGRIEEVFSDCLPLFADADLTLANLELPLCEGEAPIPKCGPNFQGAPRM
ncbi:MAG: CapA family protein, partial [Phycisphaerae bacterium]|nr:CapA family protein [Phycisphaerae bacterium]